MKERSINPLSEEDARNKRSCLQFVKDTLSLVPKDATPPDWGILWLVFISLFSSSFTLTFLFPFLPEMILSFGYEEEEKGTYVGLVASSVFAGRAVGSFFWGWLADLKGRRLVLLITIAGNGLFSFLFGFVGNLPFAMMLRFLAGLANGTVGVSKAILYDVSDNTNQAFSMSVISIAWGSGLILGPTLGGYLALPASKYPSVFSPAGPFGDYPFILPSVCCFVICFVAFIIVFCKFKEPDIVRNILEVDVPAEDEGSKLPSEVDGSQSKSTKLTGFDVDVSEGISPLLERTTSYSTVSLHSHTKLGMSKDSLNCETEVISFFAQRKSEKHLQTELTQDHIAAKSLHNLFRIETDDFKSHPRKRCYSMGDQSVPAGTFVKTNASLMEVNDNFENQHLLSTGENANKFMGKDTKEIEILENQESKNIDTKKAPVCCQSLVELLSISDVRHSVTLYSVFSFAVIGYEDVFTVFASTKIDYDGLGFSTDEIGTALGAVSIPLMFIQIKIYPILVAKFGIKRSFIICMFFIFIPIQLVPMMNLLVNYKIWLWVTLVCVTLPLRIAANSCFAGSSLFVNNSVTSDMAGKVNGLAMTATAIARTLAPTIGGVMFSWAIKARFIIGHPFDVNFTFVFFGLILFITTLHCLFLPDHLDHQKK